MSEVAPVPSDPQPLPFSILFSSYLINELFPKTVDVFSLTSLIFVDLASALLVWWNPNHSNMWSAFPHW